jgi:hypothetical protein
MDLLFLIIGLGTFGFLVYTVLAFLKPEWFG